MINIIEDDFLNLNINEKLFIYDDIVLNEEVDINLSVSDELKFDIFIIDDTNTDNVDYIVIAPEIIWLMHENDIQNVDVASNVEWIVK